VADWLTPIEYLKGVGPKKGDLLKTELGIFTLSDLLFHFPFRHEDRSSFQKISHLNPDAPSVLLKGKIKAVESIDVGKGRRFIAKFSDGTGDIELVWFRGLKYIKENVRPGIEFVVNGKPNVFNGKYSIPHPEMELAGSKPDSAFLGFFPVYHSTEKLKTFGLDSRGISRLVQTLLDSIPDKFPETLPQYILEHFKLPSRDEAVRQAHHPNHPDNLKKAMFRLKFEELFYIRIKILIQNGIQKKKYGGARFESIGEKFNSFYHHHLPFQLTNAQKRVLKEIRADLASGRHMNRLLQGDVGSGKTVVALMTMLMALDNGFQACIMAPTEILANQHYRGIKELVEPMGLKIELLTGSVKKKNRTTIHEMLQSGELPILVGTHALLEDEVKWKNLGLAVIDEQHRFGVAQRARLWKKNVVPPHILVMTATPIPRTLAMTLYGDLDVSVIDELPPGRKPITTRHVYESRRPEIFDFMHKELAKGRQIYVVYPLIEESEKSDFRHLEEGYDIICEAFPQYKVSMVHGRLKADLKDHEMNRFVTGQTRIMVATTVIEVGVNVPNASVMLIESAQRFGLSQLHQLRGRVGRGADQSYCILMTDYKLGEETKVRMETMCRTNDGFEISEVDLQLRGPGDLEGTRQSGVLDLKVADLAKDQAILAAASQVAEKILSSDPELSAPENQIIRFELNDQAKRKADWSRIS
jgi:ATP-dependent DNA helicase RecG